MKILNVNTVLDPVTGGGTAERTVQISRALMVKGIDCSIMTTDLGLNKTVLSGLDNIHIIAYQCLIKRFYIPFVRYSNIKKTVQDMDIVHLMGHWSILNALVYLVARALGKPYVVCPAGALPIFGRSRIFKKIYNLVVGKNIIRNANAWIAITNDEKSQFIPYGISTDQVDIIPNGINPDDFSAGGETDFRERYGIHDNPFILFLGRLNTIKGPDILLQAFAQGAANWRNWHLVYAGPDGGLLDSLKSFAHENGLNDRVHFIGYVGGAEKSAAYHSADVLVIPSRQEAMSIVVLEAGICGTPVIITDQCGFDQVADIGGGIVSPASVSGIYNSLSSTINNSELMADMGEKLQKYVKENYTWSVVINKYIKLYSKLLLKP